MAEVNPPIYITLDEEYDGADLARPFADLISEGVVGADDLAVTERGAGANMSVDVAAGAAWVAGDEDPEQPTYRVRNDATVNLAVDAADASDDRIDLVIAEVLDSTFAGTSDLWRLRVVTGTAAASPSAPAVPASALVLAELEIPASASSVTDAEIIDRRPPARLGGRITVPVARLRLSADQDVSEAFGPTTFRLEFDVADWDTAGGAEGLGGSGAGWRAPAPGVYAVTMTVPLSLGAIAGTVIPSAALDGVVAQSVYLTESDIPSTSSPALLVSGHLIVTAADFAAGDNLIVGRINVKNASDLIVDAGARLDVAYLGNPGL